jgi:hypothetical protein
MDQGRAAGSGIETLPTRGLLLFGASLLGKLVGHCGAHRSQISVFGFDFWGSPTTYTGIIKAAPHDPVAEEEFVRSTVAPGRVFQVPEDTDHG